MFEYVRDSRSAIQWLTNTYLLDERSVDIIRDILLYIRVNFEDMGDKKYMVRNLLRTFDLNEKEIVWFKSNKSLYYDIICPVGNLLPHSSNRVLLYLKF